MKSILFLSLLILCLSSKKNIPPSQHSSDIFGKIKKSIHQCISTSEEASTTLKELVKKSLASEENLPLNFNTIELTQEDREVIRRCRREAFKMPIRNRDENVTPISFENIPHKKKVTLVKGKIKKPRKLDLIKKIKN